MVAEQRCSVMSSIIDELIPLVMEEIVKAVSSFSQERIRRRIVEVVKIILERVQQQSCQTPLENTSPTRDKPAYKPQFDLAERVADVIVSSKTETERGLEVTQKFGPVLSR